MINKIKEMHKKFGIDSDTLPAFGIEEMDFRIAAMQEELNEYELAENKAEQLDALVDLCIFTLGTAERMGFSDVFTEAFDRVMQSNMTKTIGPNKKRGSFVLDLIKPPGFKHANLDDLV